MLMTEELRPGRPSTVSPEQVRQAREAMDAGATMAAAARALGITRSSLNRAIDRERLANRRMLSEATAMKVELTELRAFRDKYYSMAAQMSGSSV